MQALGGAHPARVCADKVVLESPSSRLGKSNVRKRGWVKSAAACAVKELSEIGNIWLNYDVIGIDEGQFFKDVRIEVKRTIN